MKLKALSVGLALGTLCGVTLAALTIIALLTGYLETQLGFLVGIYPFYEVSWLGALAGLVDGFVDGFFGGWLFVQCIRGLLFEKVM